MVSLFPTQNGVKKILVIKFRHLGDVLLSTCVLSSLKQAFPESSIDVMVYKDATAILEGNPNIRKIFTLDKQKKGFFAKCRENLSLLLIARKEKYDLVINLTEGDRGALVALLSKAKYKVGYDPEKKGFLGKKSIFTHMVKSHSSFRHTVEMQLDSLRVLGISPEKKEIFFPLDKTVLEKTKVMLKERGIIPGEYILVHPSCRWSFKLYPVEKMQQLVRQLSCEGKQVVVVAGKEKKEVDAAERICENVPNVFNLSGAIDIKELGVLISQAKGCICLDSFSAHIASSLKIPLVVLFGPTSETQWGPWNHPRSAVVTSSMPCRPCRAAGCGGSKMSECLRSIEVCRIIEAFDRVTSIK